MAICTSHTHTGPVVGNNLMSMYREKLNEEQKQLIVDYTQTLTRKVAGVVDEAIKKLAPAQIAGGLGKAAFAVKPYEMTDVVVTDVLGEVAGAPGPVSGGAPADLEGAFADCPVELELVGHGVPPDAGVAVRVVVVAGGGHARARLVGGL